MNKSLPHARGRIGYDNKHKVYDIISPTCTGNDRSITHAIMKSIYLSHICGKDWIDNSIHLHGNDLTSARGEGLDPNIKLIIHFLPDPCTWGRIVTRFSNHFRWRGRIVQLVHSTPINQTRRGERSMTLRRSHPCKREDRTNNLYLDKF